MPVATWLWLTCGLVLTVCLQMLASTNEFAWAWHLRVGDYVDGLQLDAGQGTWLEGCVTSRGRDWIIIEYVDLPKR